MPWCPQCDEVFPSGRSCPRCRSALVDVSDATDGPEPGPGGALPQLKVPRRLRRAFDKMNRPPVPPRQLMTLALGLLVFLAGMAVGQLGSRTPGPVVGEPPVEALAVPPQTSIEYLVEDRNRAYSDLQLVRRGLDSGYVDPPRRLNLQAGQVTPSGRAATRLRALGGSVAAVVEMGDRWALVAFPAEGASLSWLPALDAAWESPDALVVLNPQGRVTRWRFGEPRVEEVPGDWTAVYQTPAGAVLEAGGPGGRSLAISSPDGPVPTIPLPPSANVLAVAPRGAAAVVEASGDPAIWDGDELRVASFAGYEPIAAAFAPDGERVAVTLREQRGTDGGATVSLAVVDAQGRQVLLERLTTWGPGGDCAAAAVWNAAGGWVFLAPNDGAVHGVQVGGGRRVKASLGNTGCALAWAA